MEQVTLTGKETIKGNVLAELDRGDITAVEAAGRLKLTERHVRRMLAEYRRLGIASLVHGNRGRASVRALDEVTRARVVELARTKYAGFNQQHLTEKLNEEERMTISRPTVRRILLAEGIKSPRKRRPRKYRRRRERRPQPGMMLQLDGSEHDWLEGRGSRLTLIGAIDDANEEVVGAMFREGEDTEGYFLLTEDIVRHKGIPQAVYSDRHSIFVHTANKEQTLQEQLEGRKKPTQFGLLMEELGIETIFALSPQAKGRIERLWGTFQDRLVSELRLAGATTIGQAQVVLDGFVVKFNRRFQVQPAKPESVYRPLPSGTDRLKVFSFKEERTVGNDNTVRLRGKVIQIPPGPHRYSYAKAKVMVHQGMDGSVGVYYKGERIALEPGDAQKLASRVSGGRH